MGLILCNAFSLNMLLKDKVISFEKINPIERGWRKITKNIIGHPDMAAVAKADLEGMGFVVPDAARETFVWDNINDKLLVAQYTGPRLDPGTTTLPDGAKINWWLCSMHARLFGDD